MQCNKYVVHKIIFVKKKNKFCFPCVSGKLLSSELKILHKGMAQYPNKPDKYLVRFKFHIQTEINGLILLNL